MERLLQQRQHTPDHSPETITPENMRKDLKLLKLSLELKIAYYKIEMNINSQDYCDII